MRQPTPLHFQRAAPETLLITKLFSIPLTVSY